MRGGANGKKEVEVKFVNMLHLRNVSRQFYYVIIISELELWNSPNKLLHAHKI